MRKLGEFWSVIAVTVFMIMCLGVLVLIAQILMRLVGD